MDVRRPTSGKSLKDKLVLKLPVISGIVEYAMLERFCRILGAMVKAGVPLPDAMKTTTESTNNIVFRERARGGPGGDAWKVAASPSPLARTELFPGAARQMFKVGEETGTLDEQLEVASIYFDRELESRIKKFTTMFEPMMIVFVGVIVGFVAVALVQAMYGVLGSLKARSVSRVRQTVADQTSAARGESMIARPTKTADDRAEREERSERDRGLAPGTPRRPSAPTPTIAPMRNPRNSPTGHVPESSQPR